jgi:DNA-binding SARP family transcriptional activator
VEFRILGPVEVEVGGEPLRLGTPRQRRLLGLLLLRAGEVVSCDRLVEELWDGDPPGTARHTLQGYVHRLRRALGSEAWRLQTRPPGYRLKVSAGELDAEQFDDLAGQGRRALVRATRTRQPTCWLWRLGCGGDRCWPTSVRWPPWNRSALAWRRCA